MKAANIYSQLCILNNELGLMPADYVVLGQASLCLQGSRATASRIDLSVLPDTLTRIKTNIGDDTPCQTRR